MRCWGMRSRWEAFGGLAYDEDGADNCTSFRIKAAGAKESPHGVEAQGAVSNHKAGVEAPYLHSTKPPYAKSKAMAPWPPPSFEASPCGLRTSG